MGWEPAAMKGAEVLILSTHGGMRAADGTPIALGYHTGHWEVGLLVEAAAKELKQLGAIPFAGACTDPCDGRTQGTPGMFDSLPYRNDAATVFRRLIRSLAHPQRGHRRRHLRQGAAGHDDGAGRLAHARRACWCPAASRCWPNREKTPAARNPSARATPRARSRSSTPQETTCHTCATPGGGCQFLGTAATSQVVAKRLGLTLTHAALAPSGHPIWLDMARRSARAVLALEAARPHGERHSHGCIRSKTPWWCTRPSAARPT